MSATSVATPYDVVHGRPILPLPKRRLRSRLSPNASEAIFASIEQPAPQPLFYLPYAYPSTAVSTGTSVDVLHDSSDEEDNQVSGGRYGADGSLEDSSNGFEPGTNDGYDWSENTNNKKKRKIPTPAHSSGVGNYTSTGVTYAAEGSQTVYSPTGSATSPRGRWKNGSSHRSPLSNLSSGSNNSLRRIRRYPGNAVPPSPTVPETPTRKPGKSKDVFNDPRTPDKENRIDESGIVAPMGQFTFNCPSPVSANLTSSHTPPYSMKTSSSHYQKNMSTKGTQTSPSMSNSSAYPSHVSGTKKKNHNSGNTVRARYNRLRQRQSTLSRNNSSSNEIWICEFCEYESIFGRPPEALMRQYDIKDRKERRRLAEKRRLLEKAKQKKKNANHHNKNMATRRNPPPPPPPSSERDSQGTYSDNTPLATPSLKPQHFGPDGIPDDSMHNYARHPGPTGSTTVGVGTDDPY